MPATPSMSLMTWTRTASEPTEARVRIGTCCATLTGGECAPGRHAVKQRPQRQRAQRASPRRADDRRPPAPSAALRGTAPVQRLVSSSPAAASPAEIALRAREPRALRVSPVAKPAPDGAKEIRRSTREQGGDADQRDRAARRSTRTSRCRRTPRPGASGRSRRARAQPTFDSSLPRGGLHDMGTKDALGCENFLHVTPPAEDRIKAGE
jgi:hypothetical protein